ncbi:MAG: hypothetical protein HQ500_06580 [Flavobacteriales bacterium]|nr:hypothetical protein [Flavobacteriales bacterium]
MKRITTLLTCALTLTVLPSLGQMVQTYEGPFESGEATYEYTENNMHEKVFSGRFSYTEVRHIEERGGDNEILITGNFKEDKKHLAWAVTVKPVETGGRTETIIGNYIDGEKSGLWTHRLIDNATNEEVKHVKASFIKNHFRGPFNYTYIDTTALGIRALKIKGSFDNDGKLDGTWLLSFTDGNGAVFSDSLIYKHGVLGFRHFMNTTQPLVIEAEDNMHLATAFFREMDKADSFAVVDGEKYGLRKTTTQHRILKPVFSSWMNLSASSVGNAYDAPLPTVLFKRGEIRNPGLLNNTMEIIPWKETPKGKREYEAQQAVQRAYDTKINVADLQFNQKQYRQALPLYKEAYAIKAEPYAREQMKKVDDLIRVEEEKKQLLVLIKNREDMWKGNDKMLEAETYYGKKDKLYEASLTALDYQKKQLFSEYRETRTNISQAANDKLTLENLKQYKAAVDEAITLQDRIKQLTKKEDTKELEKELKKLEDPKAIIFRLLN